MTGFTAIKVTSFTSSLGFGTGFWTTFVGLNRPAVGPLEIRLMLLALLGYLTPDGEKRSSAIQITCGLKSFHKEPHEHLFELL